MQQTVVNSEPLLVTVPQLMKLLQLGRNKIYDLIHEGMPVERFGRAIRFDLEKVRPWLKARSEQPQI